MMSYFTCHRPSPIRNRFLRNLFASDLIFTNQQAKHPQHSSSQKSTQPNSKHQQFPCIPSSSDHPLPSRTHRTNHCGTACQFSSCCPS
ncbi:hypothetical protein I7I48_03393 [Histoplasma ohiense]|nr:hypothetical protein I7I48_03393 [Histoplasma ohiense (nom. inval.)]